MPRGSAISGRLVDEFGDPIADALVSAMRSAWAGRRRRLQPTGRQYADQRSGAVPNLRLVARRLLRERDVPRRRHHGDGDQRVRAGRWRCERRSDGIVPELRMRATYFPGTQNSAEAQKITLGVGQEAQNTTLLCFR